MKHTTLNISSKSQVNSSYSSFTLSLSFILGIISIGLIFWHRSWGFAITNMDNQSLFSGERSQPILQPDGYEIQFPGLTPIILSTVLTYRTNNPVMGLLASWPFWVTWVAKEVNAQLPAIIDFNTAFKSSQGLMLYGGAAGDSTGYFVSKAGDVNGDGNADFLIGAIYASPAGRTKAGAVYLIYGGANILTPIDLGNLNASIGVILQGSAADDQLGVSVSAAGDLNADGKDDILVGAWQASPAGRMKAGAAYLIYGATNLPPTLNLGSLNLNQGITLQGGSAGDGAGYSVAGAGDVNGDGKNDFLVGATLASPAGRTQAGSAYLIYGGVTLPSTLNLGNLTAAQGVVLLGSTAYDWVGFSLSSAGDVNGDGKNDFLVGAYLASPAGQSEAGMVYLIYGSANLPSILNLGNLTSTQGMTIIGAAAGDRTGASIANAGDVNGDGKADFLIGAQYASPATRAKAGAAYLIYGSANLPAMLNLSTVSATQGVVLPGGAAGDNAGSSVSGAGDMNGDGKDDFLVGAYQTSAAGRSNAGIAYLIYGGTSLPPNLNLGSINSAQGILFRGGLAEDYVGSSLASVGDVNGDGRIDLLIGAVRASPLGRSLAGAAYIVYGPTQAKVSSISTLRTTPTTTAPITVASSTTSTRITTSTNAMTTSTTTVVSTTTLQTTLQNTTLLPLTTVLTATAINYSMTDVTQSNTSSPAPLTESLSLMRTTVPAATSPATNLVPIIAAVAGISVAACLAAGIGIYACRKKAREAQPKNAKLHEDGTTLQNKQSANYQEIPIADSQNHYANLSPKNLAERNSHYSSPPPAPSDPYAGVEFTTIGKLNREMDEHKAKQQQALHNNYDDIAIMPLGR